MKVCIYGAGAIGGWIGVKLAQAGHDVSVVARGATLAALAQHGLRLVESGATHAVKVRASDDPAALGAAGSRGGRGESARRWRRWPRTSRRC